MIKLFFNIFVAVLLSLSAFVNSSLGETKIGIESFQINPETDIEITSQSMVFNSKTDVTEFFTDVNVTYGQLTLSAQSLTVSHSNKSDNYSNLTFFASGPIIINDNKNFIRGDQANFNGKNQELIIVGNVSLLQDSNKIFGDRLVLDLKEGIAKISGSVRTTIAPTGKNLK
jgi:lipopolysaccharide export system protein LptA